MEAPINNTQNLENQNSEFAKKEPILYKKTIIKTVIIAVAVFLGVGIVVAGVQIYKTITETKPPVIEEDKPTPAEEPVKAEVPIFAYIKDYKSIWKTDINGENKSRILELPGSTTEKYTSLSWKNKDSLTYAKFDGSNSVIETINTKDRGIMTELSNQLGSVDDLTWGGSNYLAYTLINNEGIQKFMFKAGTILTPLYSFETIPENTIINTRIIFSEEGGYVIFSSLRIDIQSTGENIKKQIEVPFIQIYQFNGTKVDQIDNATDPMLLEKDKIAFKYDGHLSSKYIGQTDITKITPISGANPTVSFDKDKFAYWNSTGGFANALLVVYDTNLNYQRNILRGVLLPEWISANKVAGIRADNCLGSNCDLYQYQTNSLAIVETDLGKVIEVDQGRSIHSISYNQWYAD